MSDERRPGEGGSKVVEDRVFVGMATGPVPITGSEATGEGFAAGSEGGGSEVWEKTPASSYRSGGWEMFGTRGGEREAARRRVEAHPEVMPPHPRPVDRHPAKEKSEGSLAARVLPVAGLFLAGLLLPQLFAARRLSRRSRVAAPALQLVLASRGRRGRRDAERLAELLRGERYRGELRFE